MEVEAGSVGVEAGSGVALLLMLGLGFLGDNFTHKYQEVFTNSLGGRGNSPTRNQKMVLGGKLPENKYDDNNETRSSRDNF